MQDKFSVEIELVNYLRTRLVDAGWNIMQLVCSGGQAHFSISYSQDGKIKNIFPDVVAFNKTNILVGEIKEKFDKNDYDKLLELSLSDDGLEKLLRVVAIRSGNIYLKKDIIFSLIHSQLPPKSIKFIHQYVYDNNDFFIVPPSIEN